MTKPLTTAEFIARAILVHGDRYDYSKVDYINAKTKICIICSIFGEFWQRPSDHLQGQGHPQYKASLQRSNKEEFIQKAVEVHGEKFDYSKVVYINAHTKVCIVCPEHGEFLQSPNTHLAGRGCNKCAFDRNAEKLRLTHSEFKKRANVLHNFFYDYSKVNYVNSHTKVCIICPQHGEFFQTPANHLSGKGCNKCALEKAGDHNRMSLETFISRASQNHNSFYNYDDVVYINGRTKVKINCPIHGSFYQNPGDHLTGKRCPKCANSNTSKPEQEIYEFVKELYPSTTSNNYKIITPKELDIYIPELNKAIEYNGTFWHYDQQNKRCKAKGYHAEKSNLCKAKGIRLLHVREELWLRDKERMKEVILRFLKTNKF